MKSETIIREYLVADTYYKGKYDHICLFEGNIDDYFNGFSSIWAVEIDEDDLTNPNPLWLVNDTYVTLHDICDLEDARSILEQALENEDTSITSFKNVRFVKVSFELTAKPLGIKSAKEILLF